MTVKHRLGRLHANWARFLTEVDEVIPFAKNWNRQQPLTNVATAIVHLFSTPKPKTLAFRMEDMTLKYAVILVNVHTTISKNNAFTTNILRLFYDFKDQSKSLARSYRPNQSRLTTWIGSNYNHWAFLPWLLSLSQTLIKLCSFCLSIFHSHYCKIKYHYLILMDYQYVVNHVELKCISKAPLILPIPVPLPPHPRVNVSGMHMLFSRFLRINGNHHETVFIWNTMLTLLLNIMESLFFSIIVLLWFMQSRQNGSVIVIHRGIGVSGQEHRFAGGWSDFLSRHAVFRGVYLTYTCYMLRFDLYLLTLIFLRNTNG